MRAMRKPVYPLLVLLALALAWLAVESMQRSHRPDAAEERTGARTPDASAPTATPAPGGRATENRARALREPLPETAAVGEERGSGPGTLRVRVVDRSSGSALAGVPACLRSPGESVATNAPAKLPARGGSDDVLRTDAGGLVEFTLPPDRLFTLLVNWERSFEAGRESV
jgi:hypothetical protein